MLHLPAKQPFPSRGAVPHGRRFRNAELRQHGGRVDRQADTPSDSQGVPGARIPNFKPKAKHVIFLFMNGGIRRWTASIPSRCWKNTRPAHARRDAGA